MGVARSDGGGLDRSGVTDVFAGNLCAFGEFSVDPVAYVWGELKLLLDDGHLLALQLADLELAVCSVGVFYLLALLTLAVPHSNRKL